MLHGIFRLSYSHLTVDYFVKGGADYIGKFAIVPDSEWQVHGERFAV